MPNINAAIGVAQMEKLNELLKNKRETAGFYSDFFENTSIKFFKEPKNSIANYWLNIVLFYSKKIRDEFLEFTNNHGVMTRPAWRLINKLEMYKNCQYGNLDNSFLLGDSIVNIPSGIKI